jgi:hypothetical protein
MGKPKPKGKSPVVYAFIDSQNLHLGVKSQGWDLDWRKFRQYLRNKYNVVRAYVFIGQLAGNESLYTYLQECGYILVFKPTLELSDGTVKGNVDAELVLHTMIHLRDCLKNDNAPNWRSNQGYYDVYTPTSISE